MQIACIGLGVLACDKGTDQHSLAGKSGKQVKTLTESIYHPIVTSGQVEYSDKIAEGTFIVQSVFDPKGALISRSLFNEWGNLQRKINFKYDPKGNHLSTEAHRANGSLAGKNIFKYDQSNELIEASKYDESGKVTGRQTVRLSTDGNRVVSAYALAGIVWVKTMDSVINKNGKNIEIDYYIKESGKNTANEPFNQDVLMGKQVNKYDPLGNRIESAQHYPSKNETITTQFRYDEHNNVIEVIELDNNLMSTSKTISRYDDQGNITKSLTYGMLGNLKSNVSYAYEYDDESNWTKCIKFLNNKPVSVTVHRIEYY